MPTTFGSRYPSMMPNYRRASIKGGVFFFTVVLADRSSNLLVDEIDRLRHAYRNAQNRRPFETIAICVLPDHLHALRALPKHDPDYAGRWSLIKVGFPWPRCTPAFAKQVIKEGKGHLAASLLGARETR